MIIEDGEQSLIMTTSNERLPDLIKYIREKTPNPKHDLVVTSPATGNKQYIEWVKTQTVGREAEVKRESARQNAEKEVIL